MVPFRGLLNEPSPNGLRIYCQLYLVSGLSVASCRRRVRLHHFYFLLSGSLLAKITLLVSQLTYVCTILLAYQAGIATASRHVRATIECFSETSACWCFFVFYTLCSLDSCGASG